MEAKAFKNADTGEFSYFNVLLTNKQARDPGFLENNSTQWGIGFIHPKRIPSYHCNKCGEDIEHPPKIEVVISQMIGDQLSTAVVYKCTECDEFINHVYIKYSPKGIDPKFIRFDETGDYKIPTIEEIESRMERALKYATEAQLSRNDLILALRWGKKISYEIPMSRLKEIMRTYQSSYIKKLEEDLPHLVEEIKDRSYGFDIIQEDAGITAFEGTGLYELIEMLEETLSCTELPDDVELKQDILSVLVSYKTMLEKSVADYEEKKREIDESIDAEQKRVDAAENQIVSFLNKANLTESEEKDATEPLSRDYGL